MSVELSSIAWLELVKELRVIVPKVNLGVIAEEVSREVKARVYILPI